MSLLFVPSPTLLRRSPRYHSCSSHQCFLPFSSIQTNSRFPAFLIPCAFSGEKRRKNVSYRRREEVSKSSSVRDPAEIQVESDDSQQGEKSVESEAFNNIIDEWGEKSGFDEESVLTKFPESDPPRGEDEWGQNGKDSFGAGETQQMVSRNFSADRENSTESRNEEQKASIVSLDENGDKLRLKDYEEVVDSRFPESDTSNDDDEWGNNVMDSKDSSEEKNIQKETAKTVFDESGKKLGSGEEIDSSETNGTNLEDLKRCLVESFYGTEYGLKTTDDIRAEIVELINQLEALNPNRAPTEASTLLDGNWILLYTVFSELLPLIAAGTTPLLKLKRISQAIDTSSLTIKNTATFSNPFATFSFSAFAAFEIRSPTRIQVQFKEGIFDPPEISSTINLPESIDIFGQKVSILPLQQSLHPLQEAMANLSRLISGQPSLKVSIPGERSESWLVTTFLDNDIRISRGDGGLFVLVKENSSLLKK